jgi:Ca2+-binding RTX toxin-like protein
MFAGNDTVIAAKNATSLSGYDGRDKLIGSAGGDILSGGAGNHDILIGGNGNDSFYLHTGDGNDIVQDFDAKGVKSGDNYIDHDSIIVDNEDYHISKNGKGDVVIVLNDHNSLTLHGVTKAEFHDYDIHVQLFM